MKKKVLIIGCGFAGAYAARHLSWFKEVELTVIDRKVTFDFLPLLPDTLGRGINPQYLTFPIEKLSQKYKFNFINQEVKSIDLDKNLVFTSTANSYDYLIIASGSQSNFFGNEEIKKYAYKLNNADDAEKIITALRENKFTNFVISGAGYTGIEIATNLSRYFKKNNLKNNIIIVEKAPTILGPLAEWMKDYVLENLKKLKIEVLLNDTVSAVNQNELKLSSGKVFDNAMLIWVSGVKAADFLQGLNLEKNPQGRLKVDEYLRVKDNCFVVGDAALVADKNNFLRMAVQFSIYQSIIAASNVIISIRQKPLLKYKAIDLGYVVPMANDRSCGIILGMQAKGFIATFMHFTMCIYRSCGIRNKIGIVVNLMKGR